jgi:hypothetical protein
MLADFVDCSVVDRRNRLLHDAHTGPPGTWRRRPLAHREGFRTAR